MTYKETMWVAFGIVVAIMMVIDLGLSRKSHAVSFREASIWTIVWVGLALLFNVGIYFYLGAERALEFFTGYIIEESLSVDNLFVFIMIFSYFQVPERHQPKILKWGILGAVVMRAIFIFVGIELLEMFHWMIYVFGGILIITGVKMAFGGDEKIDPDKNLMVRLVKKVIPVSKKAHGSRFIIRRKGIIAITPLFLTLVMVESSDLIFALDSIPAVFAVTRDPFIVYTSNIFAIMGLRSLYFLLANVMGMFRYLKMGISLVLTFVGIKMFLSGFDFHIPIVISLLVIFVVLTASIVISIIKGKGHDH